MIQPSFNLLRGLSQVSGFREVHHQLRMQAIAVTQNKRAAVSEGHGCSTLSTGGEHEPICKQEETSREQVRSMEKGRNGDLMVLSERRSGRTGGN